MMRNLHFRATVIVLGLCFAGTVANPTGKSSGSVNSECQGNEHLHTNGSFPGEYEGLQATATVYASFNFFRVLLRSHMKQEEWKIKHLDLSNSLISNMTLSSLQYAPALEILNLSNNAIWSISLDVPSLASSQLKRHGSSFRDGLPFLKVLILQRNQLSDTPKGLWKLKSLQSLDLSFNRILQIGFSDFHNCLQLKNLYLKSNKIFKIHPDAFKDVKNLQVLDLSNNALTTVLPMMVMALQLPQLNVDLANNLWQCDQSVTLFQNSLSESWREKWSVICSKSTGTEEAPGETPGETPQGRTSTVPLLLPTELHQVKHQQGRRVEPRGRRMPRPTPGRHAHQSSGVSEERKWPPRRVRAARDVQASDRQEENEEHQDLVLAVCLSVFITFVVAFILGALTRPYVDKLRLQGCRNRSPGPASTYTNEGFYDDAVAARDMQHSRMERQQSVHNPNLYENQEDFLETEPNTYLTVLPDRTLGRSNWRSSEPHGDSNTRAGHTYDRMLLTGSVSRDINQQVTSGAPQPVYANDFPGDFNHESVAQECLPTGRSVGNASVAGTSQVLSSSTHDVNESGQPLSKEKPVTASQMLTHTNAQRTGENQETGSTEQLPSGIPGFPVEFSKETQLSSDRNWLSTQQIQVAGAGAKADLPLYYSGVTHGDPEGTDPPDFPQRWGYDQGVTPANEEPMQKYAHFDPQYNLESDYDSDEGSLFTLSSTSSEGARDVAKEETHGEECCGVSGSLQDKNSGVSGENIISEGSLEDTTTSQKFLRNYENHKDHFKKLSISCPDSGLGNTHLESVSDTHRFENPLALPSSLGGSPVSGEVSSTFHYDYDITPQPQAVEWHCSLKDLIFSNAGVPADPEEGDCHEIDSD
ncbi:leucine-rich repeat-containing protein 66 [Ochotona princeps]|uniref:leucine-rich repeat-containing protein 66 n=1 Tax=Ochotona princeps TaxID=9978 RepID=UPI0027153E2E|nr:leucine-rich repeat-containing protein 66 [Ochotona princeps]XP_058526090.1 leucine-rich repeat-containing protein 66 [Ochotona princeps]